MSTPPTENSAGIDLSEAFKALYSQANPSPEPEAAAAPASTPVAAQEQVPPVTEQAAEAPVDAPVTDELAQLRAELAARESALADLQKRAAESVNWARQGFFRKSNEAAAARDLLRKAAEAGELDKDELERFLASGGSEIQPGYAPQAAPVAPDERAILDASQFVLDYALSESQAKQFTDWLASPQSTVTDRDVVPGDHYSTLRHGYERYQAATRTPDPRVAQAAATVARVQRETAKSASVPAGRVMPTERPEPPDPMKMSVQERIDSGLVESWFKALNAEWTNK